MRRTLGKRSRTIAGLPSDDALSTTTVSTSMAPVVSCTEARHSASKSRVFQFATITATVAMGDSYREAWRQIDGRRRVENALHHRGTQRGENAFPTRRRHALTALPLAP